MTTSISHRIITYLAHFAAYKHTLSIDPHMRGRNGGWGCGVQRWKAKIIFHIVGDKRRSPSGIAYERKYVISRLLPIHKRERERQRVMSLKRLKGTCQVRRETKKKKKEKWRKESHRAEKGGFIKDCWWANRRCAHAAYLGLRKYSPRHCSRFHKETAAPAHVISCIQLLLLKESR